MDLTPYQQIAVRAAYRLAEILMSKFGKISRVRKKDAVEIVPNFDISISADRYAALTATCL